MLKFGIKNPDAKLEDLGIKIYSKAYWNESPEFLQEATIIREQGRIANSGALHVMTGEFTGRSPKDRFIVKDAITETSVDWNDINIPFDANAFDKLYDKITAYFAGREIFVRDAHACADEDYRLKVRVVNEYPWSNMFVYNMFLRPSEEELLNFTPDWTVINAPGFMAVADEDGTRQHNFSIINFTRKCVIVGGSAYTGEIKKGVFSVLNFILPHNRDVLSMHCSANVGKKGDTAVFFGLSGTGKTTLSADPERLLIGDDEHGWSDKGVFNFEGGCYAKTIDLTEEKEPDIFQAMKHGAILENNTFFPNTRVPNFEDSSVTPNIRVSYPIHHIDNALEKSAAGHPTNVFFLTCDAFGVLPPISKLSAEEAGYFFISGYTAKVAGTELGVNEPTPIFSAGFGAPFLPLHPAKYADMLGEKMKKNNVNVWLVNTGWYAGSASNTDRIKLRYTRAMITAALKGQLDDAYYLTHSIFGMKIPTECPGVPSELLNPRKSWGNDDAYYEQANKLARLFNDNFKKYEIGASAGIRAAAPQVIDAIPA